MQINTVQYKYKKTSPRRPRVRTRKPQIYDHPLPVRPQGSLNGSPATKGTASPGSLCAPPASPPQSPPPSAPAR